VDARALALRLLAGLAPPARHAEQPVAAA
jgi:hypothetical protein